MTTATKTYSLEGRMLAACTCNPCSCSPCGCSKIVDSIFAYHIERGQIKGQDVSGVTLAKFVYVPDNVRAGKSSTVVYVDAKATPAQQEAVLKAFNGEFGGVLADLAHLVSETPEVRVVPVEYSIARERDSIKIGDGVSAEMATYREPDGKATQVVAPGWEYNHLNVTQSKFCFAA